MVIKIHSADGPHLTIPVPLGLFCNRLTAGLAARAMEQNGQSLTAEQMQKLFQVLHQCKRRHRDLVLVEVESAAGDCVYVKL